MKDRQQAMVPESDFWKSVRNLEMLAKGGGGDSGTQISQGRQRSHSHPDDSPEVYDDYDGQRFSDDIEDDGTDYNQRQTLASKVSKGEPLTAAEIGILKGDIDRAMAEADAEKSGEEMDGARKKVEDDQYGGGFAYMADGAKKSRDKDDDDDDDDDDDKDDGKTFGGMFGSGQVGGSRVGLGKRSGGTRSPGMDPSKNQNPGQIAGTMAQHKKFDKSFEQIAAGSETIRDGVEISDFLADMVKAIGIKFEQVEKGLHEHINELAGYQDQRLDAFREEQGEFNKSMAEATVGIAHQMAGATEEMMEKGMAPARGPKSVRGAEGANVRPIEKAFAGGPEMDRDATLSALTEMVAKGQASSLDVVRYETTGLIEPTLMQKAMGVAKSMGLAN